jgi:tetratricopeptide (TPR) repeat protein
MRHLLHVSFDLLLGNVVNRWARPLFLVAMIGLVALIALRRLPEGPAGHLAKAEKALAEGRPQDALRYYQQAVAAGGNNLPLEIGRGLANTNFELGEFLVAAEHWAQVYAQDQSDPSFWYKIAPALLQSGDWEAATDAYRVLAELEPDNGLFHYWAGALQLQDDPFAADAHLNLALTDPTLAGGAQELLVARAELGELSEPAHRAARLGLAYLAVGEPRLAERQFSAAVEALPDLADAWAYLGLAQDRLGQNGRPAIARAIELAPESPLAHSLMGHHWLGRDHPELARPEFLAAHTLDPENPIHLADIASTYQWEGDLYSAQAWYQAAVRKDPDDPAFWVLLAFFYVDVLGDADEGLVAAQRAVALAPEDPAALDALGWAQFQTGQLGLAETNLGAARQRSPADPAVHYHLGKLAAHRNEWEQAQASFEEAMALGTTCTGCPAPKLGWYARMAERELTDR